MPDVEFPYIRDVYCLYGARSSVENVHLANEGHDYGYSKRAPMYKFMARHLELSLEKVAKADGSIDESGIVIEKPEAMYVFDAAHPMPKGAVSDVNAVDALFKRR